MERLRDIAKQITSIYFSFLKGQIDIPSAKEKIVAWLPNPQSGIVEIFPDGKPYIHINLVIDNYNLVFTLTPSPSRVQPVLLVHPGVVIYDCEPLVNSDINHYTCLKIYKEEKEEEVIEQQTITWASGLNKKIVIHEGDEIVFTCPQQETITSCDDKRRIPLEPRYDIFLDHETSKIIFSQVGRYFFTSRSHRKSILLEVEVITS